MRAGLARAAAPRLECINTVWAWADRVCSFVPVHGAVLKAITVQII